MTVANRHANIVLVDHMPLYRDGLRTCLEGARYNVIGETGDGEDALELVKRLAPDLVLMDSALPHAGGFAICREIRMVRPITRVLLMTSDDKDFDRQETQAMLAHAAGLLSKSMRPAECLESVQAVLAGRAIFHSRIVEQMADPTWNEPAHALSALSLRERQVLSQIIMGRTNRDIADALEISIKTVEKHVSSILDKCDLPSRTAVAVLALQSGLAEPEVNAY